MQNGGMSGNIPQGLYGGNFPGMTGGNMNDGGGAAGSYGGQS